VIVIALPLAMNLEDTAPLDEVRLTVVVDNETDTLSSIDPGVPQVPEAVGLLPRLPAAREFADIRARWCSIASVALATASPSSPQGGAATGDTRCFSMWGPTHRCGRTSGATGDRSRRDRGRLPLPLAFRP